MKILLVCSQGMSSAIAANSLTEAAKKAGLDFEVNECSTQAFAEKVKEDYDVALVAPQIRHRFDVLKEEADKVNVPCALISPQGYSPLGGPMLLKQVQDMMK